MARAPKADPVVADAPAEPTAADPVVEGAEALVADVVQDLEDVDQEANPAVVSAAPPRPHESLITQLQVRFDELIAFVKPLEGEIDGDLGELLTFIRSKI